MIIALICTLIVFLGLGYLFLIPLSLSFVSAWLMILLVSAAIGTIVFIYMDSKGDGSIYSFAPAAFIFIFFIIMCFSTMPIFRSNSYHDLIGTVKEKTFTNDIQIVDLTQLPVVKDEYAKALADKKLGDDAGLGSKVKLGDATLSNNNGQLRYLFPLLHRGFMKWASNKEGTPGYIVVSATNDKDVKWVKEIDGKPIYIKYQPNAFFGEDLNRKLYFSGLMTKGLTDFTFETDEKGYPYWTTTIYENTIGLSGKKVSGTAIMDAQTGDVKVYSVADTPKWVSRIQPLDIIDSQVDSWGKYVHGWWNSLASEKDVIVESKGYGIVYNKGESYFYTGMTSSGEDESTVGFMLVNTRSGEASYYKMAGATEVAAEGSAESEVHDMGYKASFPTLINVNNVPTYFMTLLGDKGLAKRYALVSVTYHNITGVGRTVMEAMSNYQQNLSAKGSLIGSTGKEQTIEAVITRIADYISENTTSYALILKGNENKLFTAPVSLSTELPITKEGDKVKVTFIDTGYGSINITAFDNLDFSQTLSEVEKTITKNEKTVDDNAKKEAEETSLKAFDEKLKNLSDEDKKEIEEILNK